MTRVTKETYINESNELLLEDTTFTYNTDPTSTIQNKSNKLLAKLRDKAMISHTLIQTNHFVKRFTNTRFTNIRTTYIIQQGFLPVRRKSMQTESGHSDGWENLSYNYILSHGCSVVVEFPAISYPISR